jgi:uncharacterized protein YndB with AHSA1/START domain
VEVRSTVAVTHVVDAPLERVWQVATDLPVRIHWLTGVDRVEVLTPGPFGAGTIWRETRVLAGGARVTEEFCVHECEAPHRFVVSSPGSGADYRMTYTFAPVRTGRHRGGTAVTIEQQGTPSGTTGRVLELMFGGLAARTAEGAIRQELSDLADASNVEVPPDAGDPATAA